MFAEAKLNHLESKRLKQVQSGIKNKIPGFLTQKKTTDDNVLQKLNPEQFKVIALS